MDNIHFSTESNEWETPQELYDELYEQYGFTLDPCATEKSAKCDKYYTKEDDGLSKDWSGEIVFMNPPYGREIGKWVKKATAKTVENAKKMIKRLRMIKYAKNNK